MRKRGTNSKHRCEKTRLTLSVCASCLEISSYFIRAAVVPLLRSRHVNVLTLGMHKVRLRLPILATRPRVRHARDRLLGSLRFA